MSIAKVNWIIIGVYALICIGLSIETAVAESDAAGRGMAWGFLIIGYGYICLVSLLNLIRVKWVRYIVLVLCVLPVLFYVWNT